MAPPLDVGRAVGALAVSDRQLDDLEPELRGAEQQVEIAERIEVAEVCAVGRERLVGGRGAAPWCRRACP